jgi:hypothetical protein
MKKLSNGALLGLSLIISAFVFGVFFYNSRAPEKSIKTVGAATESIDSDIIKWRVTIARASDQNGLKEAYNLIRQDIAAFKSVLAAQGIDTKGIEIQPVSTNRTYSSQGAVTGYSITQSFYLISKDLKKVEELALNPGLFTERGLVVQSSNLEYYNSKLDQVKRRLLAKATADAKLRATEIAKGTGDEISKIQSARVGVFQITEPYSTEVSDYGVYNTSTSKKEITVTVHVVFGLK